MTDMQRRFAVEYAMNGGNATEAAKIAGYSERSAHELGRKTLQLPHVADEVRKQLARLRARSGAIGLHALIEICSDEKSPANARVSAARALCEHAGIVGSGKENVEDDGDGVEGEGIDAGEVLVELRKHLKGVAA